MTTPIYLDHSATTPVDPRVLEAMLPYFTEVFGNPSSSHDFGVRAEQAVESARETVAGILNCRPGEVVFTSGGTESDNFAVRGAAWAGRKRGVGAHLVTTKIEHGAVGKTVAQLAAEQGFTAAVLDVDRQGRVSLGDFEAACVPGTVVASVMYANNEVGTVQDIRAFADVARSKGIPFHTDAVQAAGQLDLDVEVLGVDLLSLSAHKFYGPKGIGVLYIRRGTKLSPSQTGGGQENGWRAGTHATPLIVGLAKAFELAYDEFEARTAHYRALRDRLITGVCSRLPNAHLTGHPEQRLPSHASFVFENIDARKLLPRLQKAGIAASAASACKAGTVAPSNVILALGYEPEVAGSSLRLTVGLKTTEADIDYTVETLATLIPALSLQPVEG